MWLGHQLGIRAKFRYVRFNFFMVVKCPQFTFSPEVPQVQVGIADLNEDILHLIFENFDLHPGSPTAARTRKDLLSAAKACKAFAEPALNSLWRVLPSLLPLLLLLPSAEVVNNEYVSYNSSYISCHSPITRSVRR